MNIGTEVICINDVFSDEQIKLIPNRPKKDKIYVVRDSFKTRNGNALHLMEITNPPLKHPSGMGTFEPSFSSERFAPLISDELLSELLEETELEVLETV